MGSVSDLPPSQQRDDFLGSLRGVLSPESLGALQAALDSRLRKIEARLLAGENLQPKNAYRRKVDDGHHHYQSLEGMEDATSVGFGYQLNAIDGLRLTRASWPNNRRLDISGAGLMGPFMWDYLVDSNYAALVSAGRYTEGQTFTTFHGHTFQVFSTIQGAIDEYETESAGADKAMIIVPAVYDENVALATGPSSATLRIWGIGAGQWNFDAGGTGGGGSVEIAPSSGIAFVLSDGNVEWTDVSFTGAAAAAVDCDSNSGQAKYTNCYINGAITGSCIRHQWDHCIIAGAFNPDTTITNPRFNDCYFTTAMTSSGATAWGSVEFNNCIFESGAVFNIGNTHVRGLAFAGCHFGVDAGSAPGNPWITLNQSGQQDFIRIVNCTFYPSSTSVNGQIYISGAGSAYRYGNVISGCVFEYAPAGPYIKSADASVENWMIIGNAFGERASTGGYLEDNTGYASVSGNFINSSFGPNSPPLIVEYNITGSGNYFLPPTAATGPSAGPGHAILDGVEHNDSVADGVTAGSIIIGNDTPKWDELDISVPAATIRNMLGIDNGETTPSWKADSIYPLLDGTRSFSGVVGGILPTAGAHLATKEYVDQAVSFIAEYWFNNTASDIGGIYYKMLDTPTGEAESTLTSGALGTGDDQALFNFATDGGVPGVTTLQQGIYSGHIHAEKTVGTKPVKLHFEIYSRALDTTETLIATSEESDFITAKTDVDIHAVVASDVVIAATDRIIIKWLANVDAAGSNATIALYSEGTNSSRLEVPTSTEVLSEVFLRQDGTRELTGNWNPGAFTIGNFDFGAQPLSMAVADVNFVLALLGGNPTMYFHTAHGDYLQYDRNNEKWLFVIAGAPILDVSAAGTAVDTISELTPAAGVTVDGLLIKDGAAGTVDFDLTDVTAAELETLTDTSDADALHDHGTHGVTHNAVHGIAKHTEFNTWVVFYSDAAGDQQEVALGAAGTILAGQGAAAAPAFDTMSGDASIAAGGAVVVVSANGAFAVGGDIDMNGNNIDEGGVIFLIEQAAADGDVAGSGQIWVKTATPNELWFTDDAGTDMPLTTPKRSFQVLAESFVPNTTNPCADAVQTEVTNHNYVTRSFAANEQASKHWQLPPNYDGGTVTWWYEWVSPTGSSAGDTLIMGLRGTSFQNGDAISGEAQGAQNTVTDTLLTGTGRYHKSDESTAVTIAGSPSGGDWVIWEIERTGGDMAEEAPILSFYIRYGTNNSSDE